ncbi:glycosyltransferase family 2 protein [Paenibacillus gansuensis]|uniref:Glycosyltransferase family 2 protein n=1 Tax=Paenibacillus gansuensis TaxID=306542 RepID=A0ABW5PB74_9BACL
MKAQPRKRPAGLRSRLGYQAGYGAGFNKGFDEGFNQGWEAGGRLFEGTSIIIPTYNQQGFLQECIESIRAFTPQPYEIIVVDNGSTDGTVPYLQSVGGGNLRYRAVGHNLGFAGAVNQGLQMARGSTLLLLNNDTVVTANWLSNLMRCLHEYPGAGIVGPVTNYISGEQLVDTSYRSVEEMQRYAAENNVSDPARWTVTARMTGFCMLMTRDVFHRLGYFDEGFEIGNCEDDDYGLRLRMLGLKLVIARDAFIHHYGSVSMKTLQSRFQEVYEKNMMFYISKWGEPQFVLDRILSDHTLRTIDLYPDRVAVRGPDSAAYWIEGGLRYQIEGGPADYAATRISRPDLRSWPLTGTVSLEELHTKLADLQHPDQQMREGTIASAPDGRCYRLEGGTLRWIVNGHALASWNFHEYNRTEIQDKDLAGFPQGLPIIAPPVLKADNL